MFDVRLPGSELPSSQLRLVASIGAAGTVGVAKALASNCTLTCLLRLGYWWCGGGISATVA